MKKALLVISTPLKKAGVPHVVMHIVRALHDRYRFDIVVCGEEPGFFDEEFLSFGGHIFRCPMPAYRRRRFTYLRRWCGLYRFVRPIIRQGQYDLVHCNNGLESAAVLKAAAKQGVPVRIAHSHGYYPTAAGHSFGRRYQKNCKRMINRFATDKLACSKKAGDSLFDGAAYQNVLNPIDLTAYDFSKEPHTGIRLLQIGYFCKLKNQLFSLDVMKELLQKGVDATLYFIGFPLEDGYDETMRAYIRENGWEDRVQLLPPDYPKEELFPSIDFLLLPSTSEGLPLVALEGQAARAYCLLSDAVTDEVDAGMTCHLPIDDPARWAMVIEEEARRAHTLDGNRLAVFALPRYIERITAIYQTKNGDENDR